ncbi:MAG TPA: hypothetical protein VEZ90_08440 [Blastocatellia bacterium]|nr:hypothetical protein [Blastocatellia bacterium]
MTDTENGHIADITDEQATRETAIRQTDSHSSNDLDTVRAQFEEWRTSPGRRHIPANLWLAANRLAPLLLNQRSQRTLAIQLRPLGAATAQVAFTASATALNAFDRLHGYAQFESATHGNSAETFIFQELI